MTGTGDGVRVQHDSAVTTVTLCQPERRNAQTPALWAALAEIGDALPTETRVVVLRAEGPSFSAGLDTAIFSPDGVSDQPSLADVVAGSDAAAADRIEQFQRGFTWWRRDDVVTVAAVQGHAIGAGFQLALACDLRVLADDAVLCMREPSLGLVPDLGGTWPLVQAVGYSRALEICLTARFVPADEARELGLATLVVPRAELDAAVSDLAGALIETPAAAARATKRLLRQAGTASYDEQRAHERTAQIGLLRPMLPREQPEHSTPKRR